MNSYDVPTPDEFPASTAPREAPAGASSAAAQSWKALKSQYVQNEAIIEGLNEAIDTATIKIKSGDPTVILAIGQTAPQTPTSVLAEARLQKKALEEENQGLIKRMSGIAPQLTYETFPDRLGEVSAAQRALGGGAGGAGSAPTYQFQVGKGGQVYRIGNNGTFDYMKTIPELAEKSTQVVNDDRTGEAIALTFDSDGNVTSRTSLGEFAFPKIDPERQFRRDLLINAAQIEASFAGIELQKRGQIVSAIAQDFGWQIDIGRMTLEDANMRLNQINSALDQRRKEREVVLQYGVTRASLRTNAIGEQVTRLPFAEQTAAILSQALGQEFRTEDFELGVTAVSPDQAGRDVLAASAYTNPVPGLVAGLESTRAALNSIFSAPVGDAAASTQVARMAMAGVA